MSAFIVAEAGVNHLGDRAKMLAFCDAAKACGADAVKFQAYDAEALCKRRAERHGNVTLKTAELLRKAQLSDADLDAISAHCKAVGLKWFASVFDPSQVERVLSRGACALKIGHKEAGWAELLQVCVRYSHHHKINTFVSNAPEWAWNDIIIPVYCVAEYPARSLPHMCNVGDGWRGFSSHWQDYRIPAAAALRDIDYLEAHMKLSDQDPEAAWSLSVDDFGKMVKQVREYESWL